MKRGERLWRKRGGIDGVEMVENAIAGRWWKWDFVEEGWSVAGAFV